MTDPLYDSRTQRLDLPLLFAGQVQKETFVNESFARLDAIIHCAIEALSATPPASPADGQCWLIDVGASGVWNGRTGSIACFQQGQWLYQLPRDGLRLLNRATGQTIHHHGTWRAATKPALPSGGTTVDAQARTAVAAIIDSLVTAGILTT